MVDPLSPHRPFTIITGVIREALRYSGRTSVVFPSHNPEGRLLEQWLTEAGIPFLNPAPELTHGVAELLEAAGAGSSIREDQAGLGGGMTRDASDLAARAVALSRGGESLLLGTENKTQLLLSFQPTVPPILPLGDLYASEVRVLAGDCTVPPPLAGIRPEQLSAVDSSLRAYFEDGLSADQAFSGIEPDRRRVVRRLLEGSRKRWHPLPLIPKLGDGTLGVDLDL
jgi:hypothetical protein